MVKYIGNAFGGYPSLIMPMYADDCNRSSCTGVKCTCKDKKCCQGAKRK